MLPFICFIDDKRPLLRGALREHLSNRGRRVGRSSPRPAAFFCPSCVAEDEDFWHISYWRRVHQLPGMFACSKHPDSLLRFVVEQDALTHPPAHWLGCGRAFVAPEAEMMKSHLLVRRFVEIGDAMLEGGQTWAVDRLWPKLRQRAESLGVGGRVRSRLPFLSDLAIQQLPRLLLDELLLSRRWGLRLKSEGQRFHPIDAAVCQGPVSAGVLALAMTLLYSSNDDVYATWRSCGILVEASAQTEEASVRV